MPKNTNINTMISVETVAAEPKRKRTTRCVPMRWRSGRRALCAPPAYPRFESTLAFDAVDLIAALLDNRCRERNETHSVEEVRTVAAVAINCPVEELLKFVRNLAIGLLRIHDGVFVIDD